MRDHAKLQTAKNLIRMHGCTGWCETQLFAYVIAPFCVSQLAVPKPAYEMLNVFFPQAYWIIQRYFHILIENLY